ncbi:hypothetical protein SLS54_006850 [Diplodia seriata]
MDKFEPSQGLASIGLVACVAYLTATSETSLVLDRPSTSWAIILAAVAGVLLLSPRTRLFFSRNGRAGQKYAGIPLDDVSGDVRPSSPLLLGGPSNVPSPPRLKQWLHRAFLALVLTGRVEMLRRTGVKASAANLEALIPFYIALADRWRKRSRADQHHNRRHEHKVNRQPPAAQSSSKHWLGPVVYAAVFSWFGSLAIWYSPSSLASTYISDHHLGSLTTITPLQIVGTTLDVVVAVYLAVSLNSSTMARSESRDAAIHSVGLSFLVSTVFICH